MGHGYRARLREALDSGTEAPSATDRLANRIVMETLRLHQSERLDREVMEDIEVDGFTIPKALAAGRSVAGEPS